MRLAKELDSKLFKEFARNYYHATLPKDLIKTIVLLYENGGCIECEQVVKNKDLLERVHSLQKMGILFSIPSNDNPREFSIPLEYLAFTLL